ncbi:MAG: phosphopantetheine-binding protein [Pseudomonadota bacterium]
MATEAAGKVEETLRAALVDVLGLHEAQVADFDADTELFGAIPELDSMAVAGLLTEIEDRLDIWIEDDEFETEMLETFGNLLAFAKEKALQ